MGHFNVGPPIGTVLKNYRMKSVSNKSWCRFNMWSVTITVHSKSVFCSKLFIVWPFAILVLDIAIHLEFVNSLFRTGSLRLTVTVQYYFLETLKDLVIQNILLIWFWQWLIIQWWMAKLLDSMDRSECHHNIQKTIKFHKTDKLLKPNGFSRRTTSSIIRLLVRFHKKITVLYLEYAFCEKSKSTMGIPITWFLEIFGLFFGWTQWRILRPKNWIEPNFIHLLGCSHIRKAFIQTFTAAILKRSYNGQGSSGRRCPRRSESLSFRPSWLVSKLLRHKAGVKTRKQGIWTSSTAKTSTSCPSS